MITLITGASGALGSALALQIAKEKEILILQGRNEDRLKKLALACEKKGAKVHIKCLDLRDLLELQIWLDGLVKINLPDRVFANAGMNIHASNDEIVENWYDTKNIIDVNVQSNIYIVNFFANHMCSRGKGQIFLVSSLAAWYGLPVTPAYSASKAALKAYGEGLRLVLKPYNVQLTVIMPGYFRSKMCDDMPGPKPWVWTASRAASYILKRIDLNPAKITFPFWLSFGCRCLSFLPSWLSENIVVWLGYRR